MQLLSKVVVVFLTHKIKEHSKVIGQHRSRLFQFATRRLQHTFEVRTKVVAKSKTSDSSRFSKKWKLRLSEKLESMADPQIEKTLAPLRASVREQVRKGRGRGIIL